MILHANQLEQREYDLLIPTASKAAEATRVYEEPPCPVRTAFQRDRDRIIHSKSFRRLKHKTQVFLSPEGDHYRTRLTHTLEVQQIARTIARSLGLNEDLAEAIALGHDLGHTPFGHCGEYELNEIHAEGFEHNEHSYRIVTLLEQRKPEIKGLNLTYEVQDGIRHHSGRGMPKTLEGQVVRFSDKIAYLNHDFDDSIRAGLLQESDLPCELSDVLGTSHGIRINNMILDLIIHSEGKDQIQFSEDFQNAFEQLKTFMFEHIYLNKVAKKEEVKARRIVRELYSHYISIGNTPEQAKDFVAGMTDRYAVTLYRKIFIPTFW